MDDVRLTQACDQAQVTEGDIRRHLAVSSGAFDRARGMAAYRHAVALRKALEEWLATRAQQSRSGSSV